MTEVTLLHPDKKKQAQDSPDVESDAQQSGEKGEGQHIHVDVMSQDSEYMISFLVFFFSTFKFLFYYILKMSKRKSKEDH